MQKEDNLDTDDIDLEARRCQHDVQSDSSYEQNNASFDEMNVEDWLLKHLEQAGRYQENYVQRERKTTPIPASQQSSSDVSPNEARLNDVASSQIREANKTTPTIYDDLTNDADAHLVNCEETADDDDVSVILDADIRLADGQAEHECFTTELTVTPDEQIVVDGVKTIDPTTRQICLFLGFLVVASLLAVAAARVTNWVGASSYHDSGNIESSPSNQTLDDLDPMSPTSTESLLNWTIANYVLHFARDGLSLSHLKGSDLFLSIVNRTDTQFTFFGVSSEPKTILAGVPISLITQMFGSSLWIAHTLDVLKGFTVQGQAFQIGDMHDGMVLTSMAGYPLTIQLDPFRVNNASISSKHEERNLILKNGVQHNFAEYPDPIVPWIGKSMLFLLLETNNQRNGDLSSFIALIDASPDLKGQLEDLTGAVAATTLFVPTNDALSTLDESLLADPTFLEQFLLNHMVSGNFARSCWRSIPTGIVMSDTELRLESQAGHVLQLDIGSVVTINGTSKIIKEDLFSQQGIIQVIDKPLLLHNKSFSGR